MPYKSEAQRRYMEGCKHNRSKMRGKCLSNAQINKISGKHGKVARGRQKR